MDKKENKDQLLKELREILELLNGNKFFTGIFLLFGAMVAGEIFLSNYTTTLLSALWNVIREAGITSAENGRAAWSRIKNFGQAVYNYAERNRPVIFGSILIYTMLTSILIVVGFAKEIGIVLMIGIVMAILPLIFFGYVQKKIGVFIGEKGGRWYKAGENKTTLGLIILIFAIEFVIIKTTWFILITVLFVAIAMAAAAIKGKSPDPMEGLKRLTYGFFSIVLIFVFTFLLAQRFDSVNRTLNTTMEALRVHSVLSSVERADQNQVLENIITETEASPYRRASVDAPLYFSAQNGVDIENTFERGANIKTGEMVSVIKNRPHITDKFGKIWIYVRYQNPNKRFFTGYVQNRWFETVENDELF